MPLHDHRYSHRTSLGVASGIGVAVYVITVLPLIADLNAKSVSRRIRSRVRPNLSMTFEESGQKALTGGICVVLEGRLIAFEDIEVNYKASQTVMLMVWSILDWLVTGW